MRKILPAILFFLIFTSYARGKTCASVPVPFLQSFGTGVLPACWTIQNPTTTSTNANIKWKFSGAAETDFPIYPDPVSSVLYVKNISFKAQYNIYSAAGRSIFTGIILNNTIDVSNLIHGIYMIKIEDEGVTVQKKFIKES